MQVCGDCHGGSGPAADGLSLSEHQTLRGEFPAHGGQAAGVQRTRPAGAGDQLGKTQTGSDFHQFVSFSCLPYEEFMVHVCLTLSIYSFHKMMDYFSQASAFVHVVHSECCLEIRPSILCDSADEPKIT